MYYSVGRKSCLNTAQSLLRNISQTMEAEAVTILRKRKLNNEKFNKNQKKMRPNPDAMLKLKKPSKKMMKLFQKKAKAYNSDEEEREEEDLDLNQEDSSEEEELRGFDDSKGDSRSENEENCEGYGHRQGIMKFTEVLSAHKKLVAEKLAEEETEHKAKGEVKKEKHMAAEKGRIKPVGFLDAKEKLLISVATKGVVKLFNAVNKTQNPQMGFSPSKSKDAKGMVW